MKNPSPGLCALVILSALGCGHQSHPGDLAGGGVQTTGGNKVVSGRVLLGEGPRGEGLQVRLLKVFLTPHGDSTVAEWAGITDSLGEYQFLNVPKGRFALYAEDKRGGISIRPRLEKTGDSLFPFDAVLSKPVTLQGRLLLPPNPDSGNLTTPSMALACIPGFSVCVQVGADSVYTIPGAPQGEYDVVFIHGRTVNYLPLRVGSIASGTVSPDTVFVKDVTFASSLAQAHSAFAYYDHSLDASYAVLPRLYLPGQAPAWFMGKDFSGAEYLAVSPGGELEEWDVEDYSDWKFSRPIAINTSSLGLGGEWPKHDFPVLVRLSAPDFDFAQAQGEGGDIRFAQAEGRHLAYEIERWDASSQRADIWVNLDTLRGNGADFRIQMFWGKANASGRSNGGGVFHDRNGFLGEWHLNDDGPGSSVQEAQARHPGVFHATGVVQPTRNRYVPGVAGGALRFTGPREFIVIPHHPNLDVTKTFTLTLWAKNDQPTLPEKQVMFNKWQDRKNEWSLGISPTGALFLELGGSNGGWMGSWRSTLPLSGIDQWHLYAVTYAEGMIRMFVDGKEVPSRLVNGTIPKTLYPKKAEVVIGARNQGPENQWKGELDEFGYHGVVHSPEWINLMYETQKPGL